MDGEKILFVEDDEDIRKIARVALRMRGFEVLEARNGREALDLAGTPDLRGIILDVMMPDLDGYQTCRRLKEDPATAALPVIFLSAKAQKDEISQGMALGAKGYITKPFDPMTLGDEVGRLLGLS